MKSAQIKVGRLYGYNDWGNNIYPGTTGWIEKVKVVEEPKGGMVTVERSGHRMQVKVRTLRFLWSDHLRAKKANDERRTEIIAEYESLDAEVRRMVGQEAYEENRIHIEFEVFPDGSYSGDIHRLSRSTFTDLIRAAYEQGVRDERAAR